VTGPGKSVRYHTNPAKFRFGVPGFTCSFFLFAENRKAGREEREKSDHAMPFVPFGWFVIKFLYILWIRNSARGGVVDSCRGTLTYRLLEKEVSGVV
jgi:hypothetical protein